MTRGGRALGPGPGGSPRTPSRASHSDDHDDTDHDDHSPPPVDLARRPWVR